MADEIVRKLENIAWDTGKENLPPNFKDLLKPNSNGSEEIELQRRKMLEGIKNYVGNDPLKPWVRCIKWAKGLGGKSDILPLLELCTQKFLDDPRYCEDLRYLRIWIRYADCCPDPLHVFEFLESKKIGQSHSLFYEAYAVILELRRDLAKADEVYQHGISRQAEPIAQLREMYQNFLKRKTKLTTPKADLPCSKKPTSASDHKGKILEAQSTGVECCSSKISGIHMPEENSGAPAFPIHKEPHGDETIAIKRYAEDAIVLGIDPEAVNLNTGSHHGLIDPTINTKEAMANVLSLFNQPLPFEQVRKSRANQRETRVLGTSSIAGTGDLNIFIDDAFAGKDHQTFGSPKTRDRVVGKSSVRGKTDFNIFIDDAFAGKDNHTSGGYKNDNRIVGTSSVADTADFKVFMDDAFAGEDHQTYGSAGNDKLPAKQSFHVYVDHDFGSKGSNCILEKEQKFEGFVVQGFGASKCEAQSAGDVNRLDPWNETLVTELLKGIKPPLSSYKGFHYSSKKYNGTVALTSLKSNARNKTLELGNSAYHLKGCTGQGAFAQVYQAHDDNDYDKTVVLKIQKPPCPWEFYIYRELDKRIPVEERSSYGYAWKMHVYSDCSIMVADYGQHGTLQDVVNSYLAHGQKMDELLCMYYTIEMLRMLEILHAARIIHGDFKPDNLLIRNDSENWEDWGPNRPGCWKDQGLCLIDWGRSIDMDLFPDGTEFVGDSKTSAFRCIEMVEGRPWTFQVDGYGLCGVVHCMLHGNYMEIQENKSSACRFYKPKSPLKRYWNASLWDKLFNALLNVESCKSNPPLGLLRNSFEDYLVSNPSYAKKLKELLMKQTVMMYSRK